MRDAIGWMAGAAITWGMTVLALTWALGFLVGLGIRVVGTLDEGSER